VYHKMTKASNCLLIFNIRLKPLQKKVTNTTIQYAEEFANHCVNNVYEEQISSDAQKSNEEAWNYYSYFGTKPARQSKYKQLKVALNFTKLSPCFEMINHFNYKLFKNATLKRQLDMINNTITLDKYPKQDFQEYQDIDSNMTQIFDTARICPYKNQHCDFATQGLQFNQDVKTIFTESRDYHELFYVWSAFANATRRKQRKLSNRFADLANNPSNLKGIRDNWLRDYESPSFRADCKDLLNQVKPLYDELHAYTRFNLSQIYPQLKLDKPC